MKFNRGYLIEVSSWENDGDMRATKTFQVETLEEVHFYNKFCGRFSRSSWEGPDWCGNMYDEVRSGPLIPIILKYKDCKLFNDWEDIEKLEDWIDDSDILYCLMDSVGLCAMDDNRWSRKVDSFRVYEIPETVEFKEIKL